MIAAELVKMTSKSPGKLKKTVPKFVDYAAPVVVGGIAVDITAQVEGDHFDNSAPGRVRETLGGVGRNIAEACHRSGGSPKLVSVVGTDAAGKFLLDTMQDLSMDCSAIVKVGESTAKYNAFLDKTGSLIGAVADMNAHDFITPEMVADAIQSNTPIVAMDANISIECN
jgi:pseudouridylate synthase / pseudouridine kinase